MSFARIQYIDRLKGLAIIFVVFTHILLFIFKAGTSWPCVVLCSFHMQLFMFVSGFCAVTSTRGVSFRNKISRRILQYFVTLYVGGWLLAAYCHFILRDLCTIGDSIWNTYALWGSWYWYLKVLMLYIILTIPLQLIKNRIFWFAYFCLLWSSFFLGWKLSPMLNSMLSLEHAASFFPFFVCGMFARSQRVFNYLFVSKSVGVIGGLSFVLLLVLPYDVMPHWFATFIERILRPIMAILAFVYMMKKTEKKRGLFWNGVTKVGLRSLDIYLYHYYFIFFVDASFVWLWDFALVEFFIYLVSLVYSLTVVLFSIRVGDAISSCRMSRFIMYGRV